MALPTSPTAVTNNNPITLPPVAASSPALNPTYVACDPTNGNFFVTTGRDLVTLYCAPVASAPVWDSTVIYTAGQVVNIVSPPSSYIAKVNAGMNQNQNPATSPTFWAAYTDGMSTVTLYSAPDACTSRTSDVVGYPVPVATELNPGVEFTVYPSSVFTQASGRFVFQASSNLVSVFVRNF